MCEGCYWNRQGQVSWPLIPFLILSSLPITAGTVRRIGMRDRLYSFESSQSRTPHRHKRVDNSSTFLTSKGEQIIELIAGNEILFNATYPDIKNVLKRDILSIQHCSKNANYSCNIRAQNLHENTVDDPNWQPEVDGSFR
ncbi:hypothetical protein J6590_104074 [Homalodisca vitripennis]|nr:hypothetical protein J6590_104074 [Homalodisca vitripennis]